MLLFNCILSRYPVYNLFELHVANRIGTQFSNWEPFEATYHFVATVACGLGEGKGWGGGQD